MIRVHTFEYMLREEDLNAIKSSMFCTREGTCFLANLPEAFADALGLTSIDNIVAVTNLTGDETEPNLGVILSPQHHAMYQVNIIIFL